MSSASQRLLAVTVDGVFQLVEIEVVVMGMVLVLGAIAFVLRDGTLRL